MLKEVSEFIEHLPEPQKSISLELRKIITNEFPKFTEHFKWSMPNYSIDGEHIFIYLQSFADHVNLGFYEGASMQDPKYSMEGTGKNLRHIKIEKLEEIDKKHLVDLINQAITIEEIKQRRKAVAA